MQERYRDKLIELLEQALKTIQRHRPGPDNTTLPVGIWTLHDAALGVIAALQARAETVPTGWATVLAVPTQEQRAKLCDDRPVSLEGYQCRLCGRLNPSSSPQQHGVLAVREADYGLDWGVGRLGDSFRLGC